MQVKTCTKCSTDKPISDFNKVKNGRYGVKAICRECEKQLSSAYYYENVAKVKQGVTHGKAMYHDLSDKSKYPRIHKYMSSASINILSRVKIKRGDRVRLNGVLYKLGVNRELNGCRRSVEGMNYYEFKLMVV